MLIIDRLYGELEFNEAEARMFRTPEFSRLRQVSLSAVPPWTLPVGVFASRAEHAAGVAHLSQHLCKKRPRLELTSNNIDLNITDTWRRIISVVKFSMAQRRIAKSVTLTPDERDKLERLWFHYGNYGPKTTRGNHSFIQGILENGLDHRPLITKRTPKSEIPTPECEAAVDRVLKREDTSKIGDDHAARRSLHLVLQTSIERPRTEHSPELKETLDDLNRRYKVRRESLSGEDETPDAA